MSICQVGENGSNRKTEQRNRLPCVDLEFAPAPSRLRRALPFAGRLSWLAPRLQQSDTYGDGARLSGGQSHHTPSAPPGPRRGRLPIPGSPWASKVWRSGSRGGIVPPPSGLHCKPKGHKMHRFAQCSPRASRRPGQPLATPGDGRPLRRKTAILCNADPSGASSGALRASRTSAKKRRLSLLGALPLPDGQTPPSAEGGFSFPPGRAPLPGAPSHKTRFGHCPLERRPSADGVRPLPSPSEGAWLKEDIPRQAGGLDKPPKVWYNSLVATRSRAPRRLVQPQSGGVFLPKYGCRCYSVSYRAVVFIPQIYRVFEHGVLTSKPTYFAPDFIVHSGIIEHGPDSHLMGNRPTVTLFNHKNPSMPSAFSALLRPISLKPPPSSGRAFPDHTHGNESPPHSEVFHLRSK